MKTYFSFFAIVLFFISCTKQDFQENQFHNSSNNSDENIEHVKAVPWWLVGGVVTIIVKLAEGQYLEFILNDGTIVKSCSGIGACAIGGAVEIDGVISDISSEEYTHSLPIESEGGVIGKTSSGTLIFGASESECDSDVLDFFDTTSGEIRLYRPMVVDNPQLLDNLGLVSPVRFEAGIYPINKRDGFIFIETKL